MDAGFEPMDEDVVWEEPPSRRSRPRRDYVALLRPLLKHPGRWAKVLSFESPHSASTALGVIHKYPDRLPTPVDEWDFTTRTDKRGSYLYARFIGNGAKK